MTKKIFKRTYRVAFHPNVVKMIEGAKNGRAVMWGYHDLIDHHHEDDRFMSLDVAFAELRKEAKEYRKKFQSCLLYTSPSPRDPKTSRMPSSA